MELDRAPRCKPIWYGSRTECQWGWWNDELDRAPDYRALSKGFPWFLTAAGPNLHRFQAILIRNIHSWWDICPPTLQCQRSCRGCCVLFAWCQPLLDLSSASAWIPPFGSNHFAASLCMKAARFFPSVTFGWVFLGWALNSHPYFGPVCVLPTLHPCMHSFICLSQHSVVLKH